jgi:hypothetical protein
LSKLLHPAQIPIIAVSVLTNRNIELDLVIGVVGLGLADVPGDAGAAEHDPGERVVKSVGRVDDTDALGASNPNPIVREELFGLVDTVAKLGCPLVDVVEKTEGQVLRYAAGADVCGMESGAGDALVEFLRKLLATTVRGMGFVVAAVAYH